VSDAVLIVDDSLTVRMDLVEAFDTAGIASAVAVNLGEARRILASDPPAAIVLDVVLPDGDGVEFLAELRATPSTAEIPVVLLSSEAELRDRIRGLRTGADEYVGKPYDAGYLVARTRELLRSHRGIEPTPPATTVLLIDDSATYRAAMQGTFTDAGYLVVTAASGEEGLRSAADRRPDAIVVDGNLPGIDGPTVIRRVRLDPALRATPCLLLTSDDDLETELRALDAGADAFVTKAQDAAVVVARLGAVLRRPAVRVLDQATSLLGPKKILVVDDNPRDVQEMAGLLRRDDHDVIAARSGEEALELLAVQRVDCIVLDMHMPGLGGAEVCRLIKAAPAARDIPLVMLVGPGQAAETLEGLAAGADDCVPKRSEVEVLHARVRAQLRRKQLEDEGRRIREELLRRELDAMEARAAAELAETRAALVDELERKNRELEAFSYSVSHDLRAPLRAISGFSHALETDYATQLDDQGKDFLRRVRTAAVRMSELIEDLLALSRVGRGDIVTTRVDLGSIAREIIDDLASKDPGRTVELAVPEPVIAQGDPRLLRVLLENVVGNAWKFTSKVAAARIEVGRSDQNGDTVYHVRDNGAGFEPAYAAKLFRPFQRLHSDSDFPGTGIGLATVYRIVDRHGGRVWADGQVGQGATVSFTLPGRGRGRA
jgi:two-component system, NtrC family, sensor kinase